MGRRGIRSPTQGLPVNCWMNFRMLEEFVPIFFIKPDIRKTVNIEFNKSYDLPLDLLRYQRENSAEYLYS